MGAFAKDIINKGEFLLEYKGELISATEAEEREKLYEWHKLGSFMYYFSHCGNLPVDRS